MKSEDPEALDNLNEIEITGELKNGMVDLAYDIDQERQKRAWWDSVTDDYINQRYGIRNVKTFPWPNCANYVIPLIDSDINRIKPAYAGLIDVSPIVIFEPYGQTDLEASEYHELYFDWLLKAKMNFFENYMLGVDYMLEQGIVIWKITWKYATRNYTKEIDLSEIDQKIVEALYQPEVNDEVLAQVLTEEFKIDVSHEQNEKEILKAVKKFREGKSKFRLMLVETKDDQPDVVPCSLRYDVTFPVETTDINDARFIDYRFQMSKNDIKIAMRDEKYKEYSDGEIDAWANNFSPENKNRQRMKTVTSQPDEDLIWLHETCTWKDINNDGIKERCIVTWPDGSPDQILRFIELPYEHGMWPYVVCKREINDPGLFSSRGIPALDADFQAGISTGFNQSVDNGTITNTPQIKYKETSIVNIRNVRYVPGERIAMRGPMEDYQVEMLGNPSQGFLFQSAQYLKAWANERIGNVSSGLSQVNNQTGQGAKGQKTAHEINVVEQIGSQMQSLDLQVFQNQMSKVYYQIDALDNQFGNQDEIEYITNGTFKKQSRQEIQGRFKYIPNGRLDNSNPELRLNKAFNLLKMFLNDPDIKQRDLKRMVLDDFDIRISGKLFKTDEEKAQEQQQAQQAQMGQKQEALQTTMGLKKADAGIEVQKQAGLNQLDIQKYLAESLIDVHEAALLVPIEGQKDLETTPKTSAKSR